MYSHQKQGLNGKRGGEEEGRGMGEKGEATHGTTLGSERDS